MPDCRISAFVTAPDGHRLADAKLLDAFVRRGGGVFAHVVGWGWRQITGGKSFATESPFNAALGGCGLRTSGLTVKGAGDGRYPVARAEGLAGTSVEDAFRVIESAKGSIPRDVSSRSVLVLGEFMSTVPTGDTRWLPRLKRLSGSARTGRIPTPKRPFGPADVRERIGLILHQRAWLANPEFNWPAHPAAAVYPGVPAAGTPRVTRNVEIDLAVPRWHGTGLFAVAGEPITVKVADGAERLGLRVRVGTTTCNLTSRESWRRAPLVTVELPLKKRTTTFASPFGGLVYVVVPNGRKGIARVEIGPACPAARFVDGRDSKETWAKALKACSAPMAEIESDVIAIAVPRSDALKASDPQGVLDIWREVMANDARLAGISERRASPERMCADVQLCSGYMHSGYPIMLPASSMVYLLNPDTLRKGDVDEVWGFFHEMGHNHQNRDWTFDGSVEVTVNFFSLYNMELICGKKPRQTAKMDSASLRRRVEKWMADGRPFDQWKRDPFLALDFFVGLQEKYGWDAFIKLFAEYRALPQSERPKTDADKRRQWCERFSRIVGEDQTKEFSFMLE